MYGVVLLTRMRTTRRKTCRRLQVYSVTVETPAKLTLSASSSSSWAIEMARPTSLSDTVAKTLNRLTDRVFTEALSASDNDAMTQLIEDYFCRDGGIIIKAMHLLQL